jgi:pimeloyl-ACP methyl ester carboxylesterase
MPRRGFGDTSTASSVSVEAKREHLRAFWKEVLGGRPMALAGVSLGAAVIIDFYANYPEAVASTALIDPQGFIDGAPPVPEPFARAGIQVLGSWPLRSLANRLAYHDRATFATDDAIRVGLLHCARPGWADDSVAWLLGGGYSVSYLVPRLAAVNTLIMWGRQDEILPAKVRAQLFRAFPITQSHLTAHSQPLHSDIPQSPP